MYQSELDSHVTKHQCAGWNMDIWHPSEYAGDIGALLLGLALEANREGYTP